MKTKVLKMMTAAIAGLAMTVNVMAAGSIVGAIDMPKVSSSQGTVSLAKVADGIYEEALQKVVDKLNEAAAGMTVAEAFGEDMPDEIKFFGAEENAADMSVYSFLSPVMDLQLDGAEPSAENPVKVTFVANNMTENIDVDVLHFCQEHGWEVLEGEKVSANQIAAEFHSASPVALIYTEKETSLGTDEKSPQTSDIAVWPMAVAVFALAGVGIFAVAKSRKEG